MKYFSMFSGIGGFEYGIQRAFDKQLTAVKQDGQGRNRDINQVEHNVLPTSRITPLCVGYSEIDKYAIKVYERNFNGHKNYGDCTAIDAQQLPDFDLLVGGFPCQAFSIAGKRYGFQDTRGTLFFDIGRILANKRPRHLVLENVKGLLSHDNGKTFQTILGVLSDLGYTVEWQVLNSKDFGVPQNRERVIIVGHLGNECRRKVFPITPANSQTLREADFLRINRVDRSTKTYDMSRSKISSTLTSTMWKGIDASGRTGVIEQINQPTHSNDRVYADTGISPTLNALQGGNRQPFIQDEPRIRRLTPTECERLQGFPDDWTKYGEDEHDMRVDISDTQRYKMCGNAVTTNVIQAVITNLIECLN